MKQAALIARVFIVVLVGTALALWGATLAGDTFVQSVLQEYGVQELTDLPDYQGFGATAIACEIGVFLLVSPLACWLLWILSRHAKRL